MAVSPAARNCGDSYFGEAWRTADSRAPGGKVPIAHSHDAYEETLYGLEGILTLTVNGGKTDLRSGDAEADKAEQMELHRVSRWHTLCPTSNAMSSAARDGRVPRSASHEESSFRCPWVGPEMNPLYMLDRCIVYSETTRDEGLHNGTGCARGGSLACNAAVVDKGREDQSAEDSSHQREGRAAVDFL